MYIQNKNNDSNRRVVVIENNWGWGYITCRQLRNASAAAVITAVLVLVAAVGHFQRAFAVCCNVSEIFKNAHKNRSQNQSSQGWGGFFLFFFFNDLIYIYISRTMQFLKSYYICYKSFYSAVIPVKKKKK